MRDVLIATTILTAGAFAAWSHVSATAETSAATVVAPEAAAEPQAMPRSVATPMLNPMRIAASLPATPTPLARPSDDAATVLAVETSPTSHKIDVVDAGLIAVDGQRHALFGVEAPSVNQTCRNANSGLWACGTAARKAVAGFLDGRNVACAVVAEGDESMVMSRCEADGIDLNAWVVENGWAIADTSVDDALVPAQSAARGAANGLWAGWFEAPSEWRARQNDDDVQVAARDDNRV